VITRVVEVPLMKQILLLLARPWQQSCD
jgi:hypothetical protein